MTVGSTAGLAVGNTVTLAAVTYTITAVVNGTTLTVTPASAGAVAAAPATTNAGSADWNTYLTVDGVPVPAAGTAVTTVRGPRHIMRYLHMQELQLLYELGNVLVGQFLYRGPGLFCFFDRLVLNIGDCHASLDGESRILEITDKDVLKKKGPKIADMGTLIHRGATGEDRFYGVIYSGGISRITLSSNAGGQEIDHLQYGSFVVPPGQTDAPNECPICGGNAHMQHFGGRPINTYSGNYNYQMTDCVLCHYVKQKAGKSKSSRLVF